MFKRFIATAIALTATSIALAQGLASVDLLEPAETSGTIPVNTRIVDIYFDVAATDTWTATGFRALTENAATIIYIDVDENAPMSQPLFNGGIANKFTTMLSKPRGRDAAERFTNAGAASIGSYDPPAVLPVTLPGELNVAYFASPPESAGSPTFDGYIARVAVDISNVPAVPGVDIHDYGNWGAGSIASIPPNASVVLRSTSVNRPGGTATATWDVPQLSFSDWAMWYIPEPTTLALLALGGSMAAIRRR